MGSYVSRLAHEPSRYVLLECTALIPLLLVGHIWLPCQDTHKLTREHIPKKTIVSQCPYYRLTPWMVGTYVVLPIRDLRNLGYIVMLKPGQ